MRRRAATLADWLDDRTGFRHLRRYLLEEPLPAGTGWWFTLGSVLLFGLAVQFVTGVTLALYYAATPDHAWDSVRFITTDVRAGGFVRGLHHWGASLMVIAAFAHLVRVVYFGSYRKPREINWVVGLVLLHVILGFALTGYLLPWDQRAYWATVVAINLSKLTPIVGEFIAAFLRGGQDIGALTLTRWYAVHVLVLPAATVSLVIAHLYLMRRHGISGPVKARRGASQLFFPYQAARDLTMAALVGVVLVVMALKGAPALEPPADPTSSDYIPRPDWYFLGLFQLLKYFSGRWEVVGAIIIPGVAMVCLLLLPWLDRGRRRDVGARRWALIPFSMALAAIATLTAIGAKDRPPEPDGRWNVRERAGLALIATGDRCNRCHGPDRLAPPIEAERIGQPQDWLSAHVVDPEMIAAGLRDAPPDNPADTAAILTALSRMRSSQPQPGVEATRQVDVLFNRFCFNCHIIDGAGGKDGPDLSHVASKIDQATIEARIVDPKSVNPDAKMPALGARIPEADIQVLARWLAQRK